MPLIKFPFESILSWTHNLFLHFLENVVFSFHFFLEFNYLFYFLPFLAHSGLDLEFFIQGDFPFPKMPECISFALDQNLKLYCAPSCVLFVPFNSIAFGT